jgi:thioredoxin reductase (NADPH)
MLTLEDIRSVPLFSTLAENELELLARTSADIQLSLGEYAVHEGGEPALFAVLAGKMEVVKVINGSERRLGWRLPGTIFGEVPIALGTPFPGAYRAAEPSRVMRVALQQYYAIAAASTAVSTKVGALARERIGGLQGIFSEPPKPRLTIFGDRFDPTCGALRRFLEGNQITFEWLTPDSPDVMAHVAGSGASKTDCPLVLLEDGTWLRQPSTRDLAQRLGLQTCPRADECDTPPDCCAAAGCASCRRFGLVLEQDIVRFDFQCVAQRRGGVVAHQEGDVRTVLEDERMTRRDARGFVPAARWFAATA